MLLSIASIYPGKMKKNKEKKGIDGTGAYSNGLWNNQLLSIYRIDHKCDVGLIGNLCSHNRSGQTVSDNQLVWTIIE